MVISHVFGMACLARCQCRPSEVPDGLLQVRAEGTPFKFGDSNTCLPCPSVTDFLCCTFSSLFLRRLGSKFVWPWSLSTTVQSCRRVCSQREAAAWPGGSGHGLPLTCKVHSRCHQLEVATSSCRGLGCDQGVLVPRLRMHPAAAEHGSNLRLEKSTSPW